ncbi:MAG: hypothetical protein WCS54_06805 [Fibrobacteraceae bacterium]
MYKLKSSAFSSVVLVTAFVMVPSFALDLNAVFDNQKKAAFPDTCEMQMRTTVTLPGQAAQVVDMTVINAGESKSVTTIKSSVMQMKMVQNDGRMKVTDLKTGKALPAQNMPQQNPADVSKQMGSPADYNTPVKDGGLWKITPKNASKPTLYYSAAQKRVVKMTIVMNGATAKSEFEYCGNSCALPGTLKKVSITTALDAGGTSNVVMEVLSAKQRKVLPSGMFDLE